MHRSGLLIEIPQGSKLVGELRIRGGRIACGDSHVTAPPERQTGGLAHPDAFLELPVAVYEGEGLRAFQLLQVDPDLLRRLDLRPTLEAQLLDLLGSTLGHVVE